MVGEIPKLQKREQGETKNARVVRNATGEMPELLEQRGKDTEVARSNGAELPKAARGNVAGETPELIRQHGKRGAEAARVAW
jgi:hypothetical protein